MYSVSRDWRTSFISEFINIIVKEPSNYLSKLLKYIKAHKLSLYKAKKRTWTSDLPCLTQLPASNWSLQCILRDLPIPYQNCFIQFLFCWQWKWLISIYSGLLRGRGVAECSVISVTIRIHWPNLYLCFWISLLVPFYWSYTIETKQMFECWSTG